MYIYHKETYFINLNIIILKTGVSKIYRHKIIFQIELNKINKNLKIIPF